ncbi:M23 family metallopeptidase [Chryseobacterium sp.]|uniref:M23 family metallopeptidase n=1 Tax=Chryseobacterium sp. TaxID=1871047 RepID=UPI0012A9FB7E|nr:M23 family metallopeptidase [Chryseobacterium sp.]QFG52571.1 M23 family metallopeptidase [Chryseobacterium sp.]
MKKLFTKKRKMRLLLGGFLAVIFAQSLIIAKLWTTRDDRNYEVNLVKINTQKDSVDYARMKNDLLQVDNTVRDLNSFLASRNVSNLKVEQLDQDSLASSVYLAKQSNRYSQYLMDLQNKLMQVPLGMPTDGYISSNFGKRKNPIPFRTVLASVKTPTARASAPVAAVPTTTVERKVVSVKIVEEKDSLGNISKKTVPVYANVTVPASAAASATISAPASAKKSTVREVNNAPAEPDQIQFHKGMDFAVSYGSDVRCTAAGTVIFAGQKGGYGNCVIVSHGNGLATLYAHLSDILVRTNDKVKVNHVIAKSGNSGRSTGPHLHYEVHKNNTPVNPKLFMNF